MERTICDYVQTNCNLSLQEVEGHIRITIDFPDGALQLALKGKVAEADQQKVAKALVVLVMTGDIAVIEDEQCWPELQECIDQFVKDIAE